MIESCNLPVYTEHSCPRECVSSNSQRSPNDSSDRRALSSDRTVLGPAWALFSALTLLLAVVETAAVVVVVAVVAGA